MTLPLFRAVLPLLLAFALTAPAASGAADEAILIVDQSVGGVGVQRDGKRLTLPRGAALQEQDLIVTERNGRLSLRLGRHGFVEVGPDAEVGVERLPFAAFARDLKSIFSIGKGYFRVVWKHPQLAINWPLYVYMSGHRVSLTSGEYFFQNLGNGQRACVAAGQMALQAAGGDGVETIKPPSCVELTDTGAAKVLPRNPDDWIAVRRGFNLDATAASAALASAATPPVAAPATPGPATSAPAAPSATAPAPSAKPAAVVAAPAAPALPVAPAKPAVVTAPLIIGEVRTLPPRPAAAAAPGKGWALNAASYTEAPLAEAEAARLRAAGFANVATQPATINGKVWYRVQIGGFNDEPSARAAAVELKNKLGLQNVWVLKP